MTEGRLSLTASAYVELHLWLAASAKTDAHVGPELEPAKNAYRRSLADDDEDALLDRTTRALSACADDACAFAATRPEGFGYAYARALPGFVQTQWLGQATMAWAGLELGRAVLFGPEADAIFARAKAELDVAWPDHAIAIDVVSTTPPSGRRSLFPIALAARGACFVRSPRVQGSRVDEARALDCLLVRALVDRDVTSPLRDSLARELGPGEGERAWSLLAVHLTAAIVAGWEPKHVSVDRRSAAAVEGARLAWLAKEWRGKGAEDASAFARRFAARWRDDAVKDD